MQLSLSLPHIAVCESSSLLSSQFYILWADHFVAPLSVANAPLSPLSPALRSAVYSASSHLAPAPVAPTSSSFSFSNFSSIAISTVWKTLSGGTWPLKVAAHFAFALPVLSHIFRRLPWRRCACWEWPRDCMVRPLRSLRAVPFSSSFRISVAFSR